jgi:hypothetical protein
MRRASVYRVLSGQQAIPRPDDIDSSDRAVEQYTPAIVAARLGGTTARLTDVVRT